ncbi:ester cyclase [Acidisoma cladoniae]|jgi:predicted ester cyclase|uniref:ester cyclase n=1 Tax=Acidisoma cladoniae TaxID=3040935 RepID=UPI00254C18E1|nr:ester cyclase [Acidisoma sp. PAMC 29798]
MTRDNLSARAILALAAPVLFMTAAHAQPLKIDDIVVATSISAAQQATAEKTARHFYEFWNTGDARLLDQAIAPGFVDHTLPPGRPQGPTGPAYASSHFRMAVPDLQVEVQKMVIAGDYVAVHMVFTGHFTGVFGKVRGKGQTIRFIATDLLKLTDGRVTDNWHIEDNLTLLQSMGIAKLSG